MTESVLFLNRENAQKAVEESYASGFFSDSIKDIVNISEKNEANPAQLSVETTAYIDGNSEDIPKLDKEKINEPLNIIASEYAEQATENLAINQLKTSEDKEISSAFKSYETLNYVTEKNHPQKVQAIAESAYFRNMRELVSKDKMTAEEAIKLGERYVKTQISMMYKNYLSNPEMSEKQGLELREKILNGTTGDETIDSIPYEMRKEALIKVENDENELQKGMDEYIARRRSATTRYIEDKLIELDNSDLSGLDKQIELNNLRGIAQTPDQVKFIDNWDKDSWEPSQSVSLAMEEAERDGRANRAFYKSLHDKGFISTKIYRQKLNSLNDYLNQTMQSGEYKTNIQRFKGLYTYDRAGKNEAYEQAVSNYMMNLSKLNRVATPEDHEDAFKKALDVSQAFPGAADPQRPQNLVAFRENYDVSFDAIHRIEEDIAEEERKSRNLKRDEFNTEKYNTIVFGQLGTRLLSSGVVKDRVKANELIADYRKIKESQ